MFQRYTKGQQVEVKCIIPPTFQNNWEEGTIWVPARVDRAYSDRPQHIEVEYLDSGVGDYLRFKDINPYSENVR
jgi:hypothetical protein